MGSVRGMIKVATGAGAGVALVTALPIFGAVGTVTAVGLVVGSLLGAMAGAAEEVIETRKLNTSSDNAKPTVKRRKKAE